MEELFRIEASKQKSSSTAATFCTVLGVLTWIGGLIIAISAGNTTTYFGESFNFIAFLTPCLIYGIVGGVMFCMAELFRNVKSIADSLKSMRVLGDRRVFGTVTTVAQNATNASSGNVIATKKDPIRTMVGEKPSKEGVSKIVIDADAEEALKNELTVLKEKGTEWIPVDQAGEIGKEMESLGLFVRERVYAPSGFTVHTADAEGFYNRMMVDGKLVFWKMEVFVPRISAEEFDQIKRKLLK